MFERLVQDLRIARRSLSRSPGYVIVAVGTLALGIGFTTALFTVVNAILLRPLAFPQPDRLVMVWERAQSGRRNVVQTQNYLDWRARNRSFDGIAALHQLPINVATAGSAEQVIGLRVTSEFFEVLGVAPLSGRGFRPGEDVAGGPNAVVLGHRYWMQRYAGSASALGQTLSVNGAPHEIVGVMPPGFAFPGVSAELFVPLKIDRSTAPREGRNFSTVARLRAGVPLAAAQANMEAIAADTERERPALNSKWSAAVVPLIEQATGSVRRPLTILFIAVLCVLLVACANVANLAMMRATVRAHDLTICLALGARRSRVVHQLVIESLVVAVLGGLLGLLLARAAVPSIVALFPPNFPLPRAEEISIDRWVLAFTAAVTLGAALAFGVAPGLQAGGRNLADALYSRRSVAGIGRRTRAALVIAEVAVTVVLVAGAALMARSLIRLSSVDTGFQIERILTTRMMLVLSKNLDATRRAAIVDRFLERVRAIPGVRAAASIHFLPLSGGGSGTFYYRADRPAPGPGDRPGGAVSVISPDYFRTMGVPVLLGREFDTRDGFTAPLAAVINNAFARQFFDGEPAVGKRLKVGWGVPRDGMRSLIDNPEFEIVGVVGDTRDSGLQDRLVPRLYLAQAQVPSFSVALVIRTDTEPLTVAAAVRREIHNIDPDQGVLQVDTMESVLADSIARPRFQAVLLGGFGILALVLASVGLYGVISYSVEQRRREMGVRLALGAEPRLVARLVLREGLTLTIAGLALGLAASAGVTRYARALLFEVEPTDPAVLTFVAATLIVTAAAACFVPARRATRVDPALVLREP